MRELVAFATQSLTGYYVHWQNITLRLALFNWNFYERMMIIVIN